MHASMWETNRRPFVVRCGGYPLWIVLDNQHPCGEREEKKEGRWAGAVGKRHVCLSSAGAQGASTLLFSESPPSNYATLSKYQV
ncbi:hypothetical protein P9597_26110 [Aneurinibacillus migulanus]|uniref:hypothetical protein n=1 Tax=Aneurinibacillus migulanus TaxID=47500 RepID=UPI002E1C1D70|nr:hypothetical protein [Aneurinibacillus migulanus]